MHLHRNEFVSVMCETIGPVTRRQEEPEVNRITVCSSTLSFYNL